MPRYILPNGKAIYSDKDIPDDQVDDFISSMVDDGHIDHPAPSMSAASDTTSVDTGAPIIDIPDKPNPIRKVASAVKDIATTPLTTRPSIEGNRIANWIDPKDSSSSNVPLAMLRGFHAGTIQGLGDLTTSMTNPLDLATMIGTEGAGWAAKRGFGTLAKIAHNTARAGGVGAVIHGGSKVLSPDSTMVERGEGGLEALMGIAGYRSKLPEIGARVATGKGPIKSTELPMEVPVPEAVANAAKTKAAKTARVATNAASEANLPEINLDNVVTDAAGNLVNKTTPKMRVGYKNGKWINKDTGEILNPKTGKPTGEKIVAPPDNQSNEPIKPHGGGAYEEDLMRQASEEIRKTRNLEIDNTGEGSNEMLTRWANEAAAAKSGNPISPTNTPELMDLESARQNLAPTPETTGPVVGNAEVQNARTVSRTGEIVIPGQRKPADVLVTQKDGTILNKNTGEVLDSTGQPITEGANAPVTPDRNAKLPRELAGAKPKYNVGSAIFNPQFESDLDKAAFIIARPTKSPADAKYLKFVMENTGLDELGARELGLKIRDHIKSTIRTHIQGGGEVGDLNVPTYKEPISNASGIPPTNQPLSQRLMDERGSATIIPEKATANETPAKMKARLQKEGKKDLPILEEEVGAKPEKPGIGEKDPGKIRTAIDTVRGMMSVDLPFSTSAAFRQAMPWVGTKNWFKAWATAAKSYGSQAAHDAFMANIKESPLFRDRKIGNKTYPSFADEIGVRMIDVKTPKNARLEGIRSQLAEKIPLYGRHIKASNRAFAAFLNDLKSNQLTQFVKDGQAMAAASKDTSLDLTKNIPLAKEFAEFLNDSTGSGSLKFGVKGTPHQYSLEQHAQKLADAFFSPRLTASRINMLNPSSYIMGNKAVRKQYMNAMLRTVGAWWGFANLAQMAGGKVVTDPNNSDFGKIKIGNTRFDPGAGFQQFLVLGHRVMPKNIPGTNRPLALPTKQFKTGNALTDLPLDYLGTPGGQYASSISGTSRDYGVGFNAPTRADAVVDFTASKAAPIPKLIWDIFDANERRPVYLGDRVAQLFLPMATSDVNELLQENPELLGLGILSSGVGFGGQTYTGAPDKPKITPMLGMIPGLQGIEKYDYKIGGR